MIVLLLRYFFGAIRCSRKWNHLMRHLLISHQEREAVPLSGEKALLLSSKMV